MPPARWYTKTNVLLSPPGRLSSSTATLVDSALAGRVSAALSVVTELNFPLSGTMSTASATHRPITNHGTHRPANRPAGASSGGATLTAIRLPPTYGLHRLPDADFVPSESETTVNAVLRPVGRTRCRAHAPSVVAVRAGGDGVDPSATPRNTGEQYRGTTSLPRMTTAVRRNRTDSALAF